MRRANDDKAVDELALVLDRLWEFRSGAGRSLPDFAERLLVFLRRRGGSVPLSLVQKRFKRSAWAIGRGSRQMAAAGLLQISRSTKDGRHKVLEITANGDRLVDYLNYAIKGSRDT